MNLCDIAFGSESVADAISHGIHLLDEVGRHVLQLLLIDPSHGSIESSRSCKGSLDLNDMKDLLERVWELTDVDAEDHVHKIFVETNIDELNDLMSHECSKSKSTFISISDKIKTVDIDTVWRWGGERGGEGKERTREESSPSSPSELMNFEEIVPTRLLAYEPVHSVTGSARISGGS
jgi:hypothetical protein